MAELLRFLRDALYQLSSIQVYGVGIDFILHLLLAFVAVLALYKYFSLRSSVYLVAVLIAAKEVLDLFAKSRIDYIRSPTLDVVVDVVFGCIGIAAAVLVVKWRETAVAPEASGNAPTKLNAKITADTSHRGGVSPLVFSVVLAAFCLLLLVTSLLLVAWGII